MITDHKTNGLNEQIEIDADGRDPLFGNASHDYVISVREKFDGGVSSIETRIVFQHGHVKEVGVNGLTNEALIAVVIDRLRGFQEGSFKCRENALALTHFEEGLMWLKKRTESRIERGVEGTNKP